MYRKSLGALIFMTMLQGLLGCTRNIVVLQPDLLQPPGLVATQAAVNGDKLEFEGTQAGWFVVHFTGDDPCRNDKNGKPENDLYGKLGQPAHCIAGGIKEGGGLFSYPYSVTYESARIGATQTPPPAGSDTNNDPSSRRPHRPFIGTSTTPCRGCEVAGGSNGDSSSLSRNAAAVASGTATGHDHIRANDSLPYEGVHLACKGNAVYPTDENGAYLPIVTISPAKNQGIVWIQESSADGWSITFKTPICKYFDPNVPNTLDYNSPACALTDEAIAKADPLNPYEYYITIPDCGSAATPFKILVTPPPPQPAAK